VRRRRRRFVFLISLNVTRCPAYDTQASLVGKTQFLFLDTETGTIQISGRHNLRDLVLLVQPCVPSSRSKQPIFSNGFAKCNIGQEIRAKQLFSSQRTCPISKCKSLLYFPLLVRLAVCSEDWVPHHLHRQWALQGV
jgi:hypothetical protein